jgi:hypothetical protein
MLRSVARQYNDILLESERDYLRRAFTLSVDAQRLYARLLTRKGPLIRIDSLCYREVFDVEASLAELDASALLLRDPPLPADQFLERLTREELAALFPYVRVARKDQQVDTIAARYPDHHVRELVGRRHGMCVTLDGERLSLMQTLFFGESRADLSTFVLEDLGMWRFETYALEPGHRQFRDRRELDDFLAMSALRVPLRRLEARWQHDAAVDVLAALWDIRERRALERVRGGLVNLLGRCAERAADYDVALSAYGRASRAPGRERRVRLLRRLGDHAAAAASLDAIERAPLSAGERYFARQFRLPRRRGRRGPPERVQRICAPPTDGVEAAALAALTRDGGDGRHLENLASLGMLGLAFWDIVFAPVDGAFVNPYQDRPLDLYWNDFRRTRSAAISTRLAALAQPCALMRAVCATHRAKHGVSNALVDWRALDAQFIRRAVRCVPTHVWLTIFDYMLDDLEQTRTGFPDLTLLFGRGRFQFVEVKGPGDQLRREQRLWFELFAKADIDACVLRVEW